MKNNPIGYLGILGLVGVLGFNFFPRYYGLSCFSFFLIFFLAFSERFDERVNRNVTRACRNAFIFVMAGLATIQAAMSYLTTFLSYQEMSVIVPLGVILLYGLASLSFFLSYYYYQRRGD